MPMPGNYARYLKFQPHQILLHSLRVVCSAEAKKYLCSYVHTFAVVVPARKHFCIILVNITWARVLPPTT